MLIIKSHITYQKLIQPPLCTINGCHSKHILSHRKGKVLGGKIFMHTYAQQGPNSLWNFLHEGWKRYVCLSQYPTP